MAIETKENNERPYTIEFEPDFEVTQVPVEDLEKIGIEQVERLPEIKDDQTFIKIKTKRENARSTLAIIFIAGFILLLTLSMILGFLAEGDKINNIREVMLTLAGILSGPLGFVVGYYFRRTEE